ncbi:MAG TPA: hypothetical protein VMB70_03315, partial [Terriglobia bacterium]|nr:hypothetical protein [Terriglobia bacterium]
MAKKKAKAKLMVADGAGGIVEVKDSRFETNWPITFDVEAEYAEGWLEYLQLECQNRNWSSASIGQLEATENSGCITIRTGET